MTVRRCDWVRSVTDAFAAEGFIAVAPDLLSGVTPAGSDHPFFVGETRVIPTVAAIGPRARTSRLDAVRSWALDLPVANGRLGMVGSVGARRPASPTRSTSPSCMRW